MELILTLCNVGVGSLLMTAGLTKLVAPRHLAQALVELFPRLASLLSEGVVRVLAAAELVLAVVLLVSPQHVVATAGIALYGVGIVVIGALAHHRQATTACGCFGLVGARPLGLRNSLFGLVLVAALMPDWTAMASPSPSDVTNALVGTSAILPLWVVWANRSFLAQAWRR